MDSCLAPHDEGMAHGERLEALHPRAGARESAAQTDASVAGEGHYQRHHHTATLALMAG